MIEFNGIQSVECKQLVAKEKAKRTGVVFGLFALVSIAAVLIIGIVEDRLINFIPIVIILLAFPILAFIIPKSCVEKIEINSRIVFDFETDTATLYYSSQYYTHKHPSVKNISKIKSVLDYGICYCIIFKHGDITNAWVCEKRLLSKGSIEEFENLFKDKIKVKTHG